MSEEHCPASQLTGSAFPKIGGSKAKGCYQSGAGHIIVLAFLGGCRMATVSLYEELLALFRQFDKHGREAREISVIEIWRKTLGAEDHIILSTLSLLRSALGRAVDQVNSSPNLDAEDKAVAISAMQPLDNLINPELLHKSFADVANHVAPTRINMLVLLANSLKPEFPESTLAADDVSRFGKEVDDLGETVRSSNHLDTVQKNRMLRHIDYINSSIRNIELTGIDALYTAFGPPLLFLRHEINNQREEGDETLEPKKVIFKRMEELFERIIERMG